MFMGLGGSGVLAKTLIVVLDPNADIIPEHMEYVMCLLILKLHYSEAFFTMYHPFQRPNFVFLSMISSSRNDNFAKFVCLSLCVCVQFLFLSFKHLKHSN